MSNKTKDGPMRSGDMHRELNDVKELLGARIFPSEPNRKPTRCKSQLDRVEKQLIRIEALLKVIFGLLNSQEAVKVEASVGPSVLLGDPDPEGVPVPPTVSRLPKGATGMKIQDKGKAGTKSRVRLFPKGSTGEDRTIDQQDHPTTVETTDALKAQGVRVAEDGLSYIYERLAITDRAPDGSNVPVFLNAKVDADLTKGETRDLVAEIECEIVAEEVPEANDVDSIIGPSVPLTDPDPD